MGTINYLQAIKPDTAYIKRIITNSLLFDWAINIEYREVKAESVGWELWDNTFFALRSAGPVIESLMKCYAKKSRCVIRIHAEKFHPQSRLLYTVYNPSYIPGEARDKTGDTQPWLSSAADVLPARERLIS